MKIDVLGVKINSETRNGIIFLIKNLLAESRQIFIVTPYSEMIVRAQKDASFRDILNSATFALPDGIGTLWSAHYLKYGKLFFSLLRIVLNPKSIRDPIPEKISGSDFIWDLARLAAERGYSVFLLGGFDDTPALAAKKLRGKFPNLKIAGVSNLSPLSNPPPQGEGNNTVSSSPLRGEDKGGGEILDLINSSSADFLFVALGPGTQEQWISDNLPNLRVKLTIGLGGTFDYLAGKSPPAPQIWAKMGLEWLWRLITQPWRLGRILRGILGLIWYSVSYRSTIKN